MNALANTVGIAATARPFRLLVVSSDTFPPQRVDVSVLFGEELSRRGHKIDWILQSEAECGRPYRTEWGGGTVWVAPTDLGNSLLRRMRKHIVGIWHDAKVFQLLRGDEYDAVEVKDKFLAGVFGLLAARLNHKRFLYWLSFPYPEFYLSKARDGLARYPLLYRIRGLAFKWLLYRLLLPAADHVFVQSEQMKRDVAAQGVPAGKLTAVPMGIRLDRQVKPESATERTRIAPTERCFLYLGTLARERRIDFLLRVLVRVRARMPAARLYLVGKSEHPEDEEVLKEEARRLGVSAGVEFVGHLAQREAFRYVQDADVCVSPFYPTPIFNSTSPTKLIEYMAMGKAVVANTHPEQNTLIGESECGYCVPYDEDSFAEAIVKLLGSPDKAREMGLRGRKYVMEHRAYGIIADLVERQLCRVIEGKHA
jgi:glycosyltransferase involved in cell wall biosynthesis